MPKAAGILFVHDGRVLLLKRAASAKDHPNTWGLPGGHIEDGETPSQAARREMHEETGIDFTGRLTPLFESRDGFRCYYGEQGGDDEPITPTLNSEHTAFKWAAFDDLPSPLHPSLVKELRDMPLNEGKSDAARSENIKTEIESGKDPKQAAAIAYSVQRKAEHAHDADPCAELHRIADWFIAQGKK